MHFNFLKAAPNKKNGFYLINFCIYCFTPSSRDASQLFFGQCSQHFLCVFHAARGAAGGFSAPSLPLCIPRT